jgi:hypothetical protein
MPFSDTSYDPETLSLLERAFKEAWSEIQVAVPAAMAHGTLETTRKMMALRIMAAAKDGERNPDRLKAVAIQAVDGRDFG